MSRASEPTASVAEMRRALRNAALLTSGAGIGFGILTVAAWWLLGGGRRCSGERRTEVSFVD